MIEIDEDIRIYDDTGRGETYDIEKILYYDEDIIVAQLVHSNFDEPVHLIINRHTRVVSSEQLEFYYAHNYVNKVKQYLLHGGSLFSITLIDTIRDGGTKIIKTSKNVDYYVEKRNSTIHSEYPPTKENEVNDDNLTEYILDRVQAYIEKNEQQLEHDKKLLVDLDNAFKYKQNLPF